MLFVCRECGWETEGAGEIPPLKCEHCGSADGRLDHSHQREPPKRKKPIDASSWYEDARRPRTDSSGVLTIRAPYGALGLSGDCVGILGLLGFMRRPTAYLDVWEFHPNRRRIAHKKRRGSSETVAESFPFSAVLRVQLANNLDEDWPQSVYLQLKMGRTIFISHDPEHAAEIASFLEVPLRKDG
jgi:hypothetical protein